jgi:hypothetical protein
MTLRLPDAPASWSPSDREVWNRLIKTLETNFPFDKGRRSAPLFYVKGTVSAPVTLDVATPNLTNVVQILGKLLVAIKALPQVDVRTEL